MSIMGNMSAARRLDAKWQARISSRDFARPCGVHALPLPAPCQLLSWCVPNADAAGLTASHCVLIEAALLPSRRRVPGRPLMPLAAPSRAARPPRRLLGAAV
jgi:hypothetical protein